MVLKYKENKRKSNMIIRIIYDKYTINESYSYIYCPNNINIKRKNIKSEFVKWERSLGHLGMERENEFFELHKIGYGYYYDLKDIIVYWINKYLLNYEYGNKAYLLDSNLKYSHDIDINADSISL